MAGPAPKTKNWTARENAHKPKGLHLIVTGLVEVSATNKQPGLAAAPSVGKLLALDLTIKDTGGQCAQILVWKPAYLHKEVSANQYDRVEIRWDGKPIAVVPVIDDTEHQQHRAKEMQSVNAKHGKKPAAKKAAKKVAKKAGKKVAKKAAKKVAKKSTLKKLVRRLVRKLTPAKKKKAARKGKKR